MISRTVCCDRRARNRKRQSTHLLSRFIAGAKQDQREYFERFHAGSRNLLTPDGRISRTLKQVPKVLQRKEQIPRVFLVSKS